MILPKSVSVVGKINERFVFGLRLCSLLASLPLKLPISIQIKQCFLRLCANMLYVQLLPAIHHSPAYPTPSSRSAFPDCIPCPRHALCCPTFSHSSPSNCFCSLSFSHDQSCKVWQTGKPVGWLQARMLPRI